MAYVTAQMVVDRIGTQKAAELSAESGSTPDTTLIDIIIGEVEGEVETFVRRRTDVTLTLADHPQTWAALQGKVVAIVRCRLAARRPPVPDDWKKANDDAMKWLADLAEGVIDMPDLDLNQPRAEWGSHEQNAATIRDHI